MMMEAASGAFRLSRGRSTELIIVIIMFRHPVQCSTTQMARHEFFSSIVLTPPASFGATLQPPSLDAGDFKNMLEEPSHVTAAPSWR